MVSNCLQDEKNRMKKCSLLLMLWLFKVDIIFLLFEASKRPMFEGLLQTIRTFFSRQNFFKVAFVSFLMSNKITCRHLWYRKIFSPNFTSHVLLWITLHLTYKKFCDMKMHAAIYIKLWERSPYWIWNRLV